MSKSVRELGIFNQLSNVMTKENTSLDINKVLEDFKRDCDTMSTLNEQKGLLETLRIKNQLEDESSSES